MAVDRSKFKPTKISSLKEADQDLYAQAYNNDRGDRVPRMKIKKAGTYKLRMYPGHPEIEGSLSIEAILANWIPGMKPVYEDNKIVKDSEGKVKLEKGNKRIFNSKVHGGAKKDLVETWIRLAENDAKERFEAETEREKYLEPIKGNKYKGGKHDGILPQMSWVMYADLIKEGDNKVFHEVEIGKAIKNQINKIAAIEATEDPLGTDGCFTDIEEGKAIKIIVNPDSTPQDYYTVAIDNATVPTTFGGKTIKIPKTYPLSDEDLQRLIDAPPLTNYRKVFTNRDLVLQLEGLKMLEKDFPQFQYINTEEFTETFAYLDEFFPEQAEAEAAAVAVEADPNADEFDIMTKDELKLWNKANKTGIIILPSLSEDDIRTTLRMWKNGELSDSDDDAQETETETKQSIPYDDGINPETAPVAETESSEVETTVEVDPIKARIAALKAKTQTT